MYIDFVLLGDLNYYSVIDESLSSNPVNHIIEHLFACRQLLDKPARVTQKSGTLLDVILSTLYGGHPKACVIKCCTNDHHFVFTIMPYKNNTGKAKTVRIRDYEH